jgi:hypothetical protein
MALLWRKKIAAKEQCGNTAGNIANGGLVAVQGDWIYYCDPKEYELCKVKLNGTSKQKLRELETWGFDDYFDYYFLHVIGDWVYYRDGDGDDNGLYKMRIDGTDNQRLIDDNCAFVSIADGWAYYCNWGNSKKLYRIQLDGAENQKLNDDECLYVNVTDNWVYYCNKSDGYGLYKIRIDGTSRKKLNDEESLYVNVVGDWAYYANDNIYKIRVNGTGRQRLQEDDNCFDNSHHINVAGDWVYYSNHNTACSKESGLSSLFKIRVDGTNRQDITPNRTVRLKLRDNVGDFEHIHVFGDWVYYYSACYLYRVRTDGSNLQNLSL